VPKGQSRVRVPPPPIVGLSYFFVGKVPWSSRVFRLDARMGVWREREREVLEKDVCGASPPHCPSAMGHH
jgi:hypothetical protein